MGVYIRYPLVQIVPHALLFSLNLALQIGGVLLDRLNVHHKMAEPDGLQRFPVGENKVLSVLPDSSASLPLAWRCQLNAISTPRANTNATAIIIG